MKKLMLVLLLGGVLFTSCQKDDLTSETELEAVEGRGQNKIAEDAESAFEFKDCLGVNEAELYAGQNTYVGTVKVEDTDDGYYNITYSAISGYCFSEIHFVNVVDPAMFPLKNGNPNPGGFKDSEGGYADDELGCESTVSFKVKNIGDYMAAHAVVNCVEGAINTELPSDAMFKTGATAYPGTNGGYFDIIVSGGTSLDGTYPGWCADVKKPLDPDQGPFNSHVFSTCDYGDLDFPGIDEDKFDLVNWLINNKDEIIGETSPTGGVYNFGDIQWAIWDLLNGAGCVSCTGLGDKEDLARKGGELEAIAGRNGEGFVPGCNEVCLVIFIPKEGNTQPVMIPLPIECETGDCEETAWGRNSADSNDGCGNMPGANWATYFVYDDSPQ